MKTYKKVKREIEEEELDMMSCDNCKQEIEHPESCGFGAAYKLSDSNCYQCGGKNFDFCTLRCLKEFVNELKEDSD